MLTDMARIYLCPGCEQTLATASDAIRRHAKDMEAAISAVHAGLTEERVLKHKTTLIASFYDAQSAWDAYRTHLKEHGILPVIPPATQP